MACGINDSGIFTKEDVTLHVPFESEHEPTTIIIVIEKFTLEKGILLNLPAASFVSLPSVINQLLCCSFLSILFFLAIMKIN